jgi:hypothetical protein
MENNAITAPDQPQFSIIDKLALIYQHTEARHSLEVHLIMEFTLAKLEDKLGDTWITDKTLNEKADWLIKWYSLADN